MALDGMTFTVEPGRITGFVGPNGAGKSTTMRVVLGLDRPDEGSALIGDRVYRDLDRPLRHVGALLDAAAVHPGRRGRDHLLWQAHSQGLGRRRVDEVLELTGLGPAARRRAGGYSLGMRQRLGIAGAMLGDPPVLLLDEPFNGLDPDGIQWIRGFLRRLAAEGRAVLVSSHLMSELEDVATHLVVAGHGTVVADEDVAALIAAASGGRVTLRFTPDAGAPTGGFPSAGGAPREGGAPPEGSASPDSGTPAAGTGDRDAAMTVLAGAGATVIATGRETLTVDGLTPPRIVALLTGAGIGFAEVALHRATLEEAYMELTRASVEFRGVS
jgi:ABC-2 type transport system ATP-binding protein